MADHVRKQLRTAVAAILTGLPTTGARVYTERAYALDEATQTPALVIETPSEGAEPNTIDGGISRVVSLNVTAVVKSTGPVQDQCDAIAVEVESALMAPGALTVAGRMIDVTYSGAEFVLDASSDRKTAELELAFRVELFTAAGVPDALL